jgi:four helix bundle protein
MEYSVKSYRDLKVWQKAMLLAREIYSVTSGFPREELYGLASQMRRACVSIPSNIAEGHARGALREYIRYVSIAFGSIAELETQITLAMYCGYITEDTERSLLDGLREIGIMLRSMQASLRRRSDVDAVS